MIQFLIPSRICEDVAITPLTVKSSCYFSPGIRLDVLRSKLFRVFCRGAQIESFYVNSHKEARLLNAF